MIADAMPFVSWFNINCGCPSARTTGCGGGSAMLREPVRIAEVVAAVRNAVGVPVSVKIRIKNGLDDTVALCRLLEVAGADFVIIHARRTNQGYSGNADWDFIKALKERLDVPLVGNGDIGFAAQGRVFVEDGYCDSFMVGRAAMCNPMLFSDKRPASVEERFGLLGEYVELHKRYLGEPRLKDAKLKAVNLISGVPEAAAIRGRICRAGSVEDVLLAAEAATSL
jgi:tRNA-dihydrouridine synthase